MIPNHIDMRLFGADLASQYGGPYTQTRTICWRSFEGKYGDNKLNREGA